MPFIPAGRAVLGAIAAILAAAPVLAQGAERDPGYGRPIHRHASARALPPETRYRDPRYQPQRRVLRPGAPVELIQAYLPRHTETPIYNEPPSRFPAR